MQIQSHLQSLVGIPTLLALAWLISEQRRAVSVKGMAAGVAVTLALAILLLKVPQMKLGIALLNQAVGAVSEATRVGTSFVFGYLGGGPLPFEAAVPSATFVLAFQALPVILVMSVLTTLLFHWGILPRLVHAFAWALQRTMGLGGAVGLSTAANVFVGMVEAPLFIRPYLAHLSRSELFVVMTGGMAGIAGTVMVLYATMLAPIIGDAFGHILIASVLGAPAAVLVARIMVPENPGRPPTAAERRQVEPVASGTMDAIAKGTAAGIELLIHVIAMLLVLIALVHLANAALGLLPDVGGSPITLQRVLGQAMAPICWLMGIPWSEATTAGALIGIKTVLNELIAYSELAALPPDALSPRSRLIMLYALCGFANLGSLGILIGGLSAMVPERRADVIALGPKSIVSGTLTTCLLGAIVGALS